jgi:hypothetical protein
MEKRTWQQLNGYWTNLSRRPQSLLTTRHQVERGKSLLELLFTLHQDGSWMTPNVGPSLTPEGV